MPNTKYLQVLISASDSSSESQKQGILCCLPNINSVELILQFLSMSRAFVLLVLDCHTVFVPNSIFSSNSLYCPDGKLIHVLGVTYSDLSTCAETLQVFHHYFQLRWHLDRQIKIKNMFKGKKSILELLFALLNGFSQSNQAFNRSKFMWFVYGICCFVGSCFGQKNGQCF